MTEYRWLLPSVLIGTAEEARQGRRSRSARDWAADGGMFLLSCASAAMFVLMMQADGVPQPLIVLEVVVGTGACAAVWLRRRWPVGLTLMLCVLSTFSLLVSGPTLVAVFTVAVHRPFRYAAMAGGLALVSTLPYATLRPDPAFGFWGIVIVGSALYLAMIAWGMFVRAQRQLVLSLRDRAGEAARDARRLERERIAREMHDVLAHRLSLLSLHAGALAFRADLPREEVAKVAGSIRTAAHQALEDLREVIGVLRRDEEDAVPGPPQPTLADLPGLVEESRRAGMDIDFRLGPADAAAAPDGLGRTVYRLAQEGLTNARKHAPDARVRLTVDGSPGDGLTLEIRNPVRTAGRPGAVVPGGGNGLIGLAERVGLAGGRFEQLIGADGDFVLRAWLPWPA
ncbi:histidine kinase [Microtetraspora sp. NBRC 13810]|uniref:sensor histidine kinase n=1 Tax=Microtetraspora sp. NBRC 13810 TaxID=3030990 RepID=UPI0025535369|nr:histidine kinase [Microtetraspora sp. NBRC 13810]